MAKTLMENAVVLGAKIEDTPGSQIALTSADCDLIVFDPTLEPDEPPKERPRSDGWGQHPGKVGPLTGRLRFGYELNGGAVAPGWADILLASCGLANVLNVYTAAKELPSNPAAAVKTLTLGFFEDGVFKGIYGAMGNAIFRFIAGELVKIEFAYRGKLIQEADVELPSVDFSDPAILYWRGVDSLSFGAYAPAVGKLDLDLGNDVQFRQNANAATGERGIAYAHIAKRLTRGTFDPEHDLVATKDLWTEWIAGTESAFEAVAQNDDDTATFAASLVEWINFKYAKRNGIVVRDLGFRLNADDLTITFTHSAGS